MLTLLYYSFLWVLSGLVIILLGALFDYFRKKGELELTNHDLVIGVMWAFAGPLIVPALVFVLISEYINNSEERVIWRSKSSKIKSILFDKVGK